MLRRGGGQSLGDMSPKKSIFFIEALPLVVMLDQLWFLSYTQTLHDQKGDKSRII